MTNVKFCVLDIETTGLDPATGRILEVGALLLDKNLDAVGEYHSMITDVPTCTYIAQLREKAWEGDKSCKFIIDMHTKSDLLSDIATASYYRSTEDVEEALADFLYEHGLRNTGREDADAEEGIKVYLAGSSIHFDVEYLNHHMPDVAGHFYHRRLDVSGLKVIVDEWLTEDKKKRDAELRKDSRHRAMPDCIDTVEELRWYLRNLAHVAFDFDRNDAPQKMPLDPTVNHVYAGRPIKDAPQA